jgi:hypothetical protein
LGGGIGIPQAQVLVDLFMTSSSSMNAMIRILA